MTQEEKYIFIIYTCKKNLTKAETIYERINKKLDYGKVYIIYGDNSNVADYNTHNYKISENKYIVLNVDDDYDHLNDKTLLLLQSVNELFPSIKGMFKCDDDVWININNINNFISINEAKNNTIDYAGNKSEYTKLPTSAHCKYCGGPLYYLSKKSLDCFNPSKLLEQPLIKIYYEDVMVGKHLTNNNIFPITEPWSQLYSDYITYSPSISYHNNKHHNDLYIYIQGGLGNQLFQLACGMKMAKKYNKNFVLNTQGIIANPHQNNNVARTIQTIRKLCPALTVSIEKLLSNQYQIIKEETIDSFYYTEAKIDNAFHIYANICLHGYYINASYIPTLADNTLFTEIARHITPTDQRLLTHDFANTYFIHIRLGDFLKEPMYLIELKAYYNFCIHAILNANPSAVFYICTNQYDEALYTYTKDFPKQLSINDNIINITYHLQDKTNDELDTLYIMSSCRGAICANSTLSYMGAFFQKNTINSQDHIYMPYPYVRFINGFNETNVSVNMYPDWCSIYNTLNNSIITK